MRETQVRSLGQEDALEKEMTTYSNILAWKIPWLSLAGYSQIWRTLKYNLKYKQAYSEATEVLSVTEPCCSHIRSHEALSKPCKMRWDYLPFFLAQAVVVVQLLSRVQLFVAPWTAGRKASLSFTISWHLFRLTSSDSVMSSNQLLLCHPLLLLPSILPNSRVFSSELALRIRWPKYWKVSFGISPSNEYSGLISFSIDWFDLLAVQGTLKTPLQHHSLKASILWHSAFFIVWLSHPYITTGKTIALTIWTLVSKVMPQLFNTQARFDTAFLPRSKHL